MVIEKIKGSAKQVGAALKGRAGILNTLAGEHGEVSALMNKVSSASRFIKEAEEQYPKIRRALLLHARAEQDTLYRACEMRPETVEALSGSPEEHQRIEQLIAELDTSPITTSQWEARFRELQSLVEHHVEEEETRLFDACERAMEKEELRRLDDEFKRAKAIHEQQLPDLPRRSSATTGGEHMHP